MSLGIAKNKMKNSKSSFLGYLSPQIRHMTSLLSHCGSLWLLIHTRKTELSKAAIIFGEISQRNSMRNIEHFKPCPVANISRDIAPEIVIVQNNWNEKELSRCQLLSSRNAAKIARARMRTGSSTMAPSTDTALSPDSRTRFAQ